MTVILQIFGLWTLKKIQKKIFFIFMNFSWRYGTRKAKNPVFLTKNGEMGFFSEVHPIFWSFFRWCTLERPKMVQKSWKLIFPDFSDISREKQIFVKFWPFLAILRCITFVADPNLEQNTGILKGGLFFSSGFDFFDKKGLRTL